MFPRVLCACRGEDRTTWEMYQAFWVEEALPVRLCPTGCRNWRKYNERVKRSQKITPPKYRAGG